MRTARRTATRAPTDECVFITGARGEIKRRVTTARLEWPSARRERADQSAAGGAGRGRLFDCPIIIMQRSRSPPARARPRPRRLSP
ncbi:hypothetical protein EVAR_45951_1 [Eumeta japonica]|uniref:Uncharacterized protein n=1 Tax=Eumeta variegata TaxID=151549 RepID=A0A4C1YPX5_EUMVA|nr:hypothetical protein EVAR_45951_1 [Eumeta japonica]